MHDVGQQMKLYGNILHTQSHNSTSFPEIVHEELHNYVIYF
jgi:hypothetical protein